MGLILSVNFSFFLDHLVPEIGSFFEKKFHDDEGKGGMEDSDWSRNSGSS